MDTMTSTEIGFPANILEIDRGLGHDGSVMLHLPPTEWAGSSQSVYARLIKPATDIVGGLLLAVVLFPVMVTVAVAIRINLGGPVLIRQNRVGVDGRSFKLLKFRSMTPDRRSPGSRAGFTGQDRRTVHKTTSDPRHTAIGRKLRKYGVDELPQLWNIIRGDMSLIGPRPELPAVVDAKYGPGDRRRHLVRPGLTGLWQVTKRGEGELMFEGIAIDLEYIDTISFKTDVSIALTTVRNVLTRSQTGT